MGKIWVRYRMADTKGWWRYSDERCQGWTCKISVQNGIHMYCCFYYCSVCEGFLSKLFVWLIILSVKQVYKICTHFFYMFLAIHQCDNDFVKSYLVYHKNLLNFWLSFHKLVNADISRILGLYRYFLFGRYLA